MINKFWFGAECSADYGIIMREPPPRIAAEQEVSRESIPGRSGDLILPGNRYKNILLPYKCAFFPREECDYPLDANRVFHYLRQTSLYKRLENTYDAETFRLARVSEGFSIESIRDQAGVFEVTFDCKPQKFLKSGARVVRLDQGGGVLHNPYGFAALPKITVYGTGPGSLQVGGTTVQIKALDSWVTLDSELQDAYKGTQNKNSTINAPEFPQLAPGNNAVSWNGGIQRVEIVPRWWTL